uniref:Uncharacterized protein n=1 Tax=Utricularia reniformis TaxID=192314 RepID=A0A1Y0AZU8_9LAMI|nr:hypothetical protein AEK19_MT0400 [Utricularia reniformis]ART30670.1 hypothetical protein AEK19_MT0400 [Utricularia reniformis]
MMRSLEPRPEIILSYGMPPVGEITRMLVSIFFKETFDREFTRRYPTIEFRRCLHDIFIAGFCDKAGYKLLEELGLKGGEIVAIHPGDGPQTCCGCLDQIVYVG